MENVDVTYACLIDKVMSRGEDIETRNSKVKRTLWEKIEFRSTPLISARKTAWKTCLREMEWFLKGSSNIKDAHESVRPWWKPWANAAGYVYGFYSEMFRKFPSVWDQGQEFDQIEYLTNGVTKHPFSRRTCISTWNTPVMTDDKTPITTCHGSWIQASVGSNNQLHLLMVQRSADLICGAPHNWLQYWAFLMWLAHRGGRQVGTLCWVGVDVHVYETHFPLCGQIVREAFNCEDTPRLVYAPTSEEFLADDFTLDREYKPRVLERAEMVV